jgi:hypothetical protein
VRKRTVLRTALRAPQAKIDESWQSHDIRDSLGSILEFPWINLIDCCNMPNLKEDSPRSGQAVDRTVKRTTSMDTNLTTLMSSDTNCLTHNETITNTTVTSEITIQKLTQPPAYTVMCSGSHGNVTKFIKFLDAKGCQYLLLLGKKRVALLLFDDPIKQQASNCNLEFKQI